MPLITNTDSSAALTSATPHDDHLSPLSPPPAPRRWCQGAIVALLVLCTGLLAFKAGPGGSVPPEPYLPPQQDASTIVATSPTLTVDGPFATASTTSGMDDEPQLGTRRGSTDSSQHDSLDTHCRRRGDFRNSTSAAVERRHPSSSWRDRLSTPTYVSYYLHHYFIVDCWHHRVIVSDDLDTPIRDWRTIAAFDDPAGDHQPLAIPHSLAFVASKGCRSDSDVESGYMIVESSVGGSNRVGAIHTLLIFQIMARRRREGSPGGTSSASLPGGNWELSWHFQSEVPVCTPPTAAPDDTQLAAAATTVAKPFVAARRPHRVAFDPLSRHVYVYLTKPPTLAIFSVGFGEVADGHRTANWQEVRHPPLPPLSLRRGKLQHCPELYFMKGLYARSFALAAPSNPRHRSGRDGTRQPLWPHLFITAGPGAITEVRVSAGNDTTTVAAVSSRSVAPLGFRKGSMNDLQWIGGWWYATSTAPCNIVRFRNLTNMRAFESLAGVLGICQPVARHVARCPGGTPYFVSQINDRIFVPYIFGCSGVVSFAALANGSIVDVTHHGGGGWVETADDVRVRDLHW